MEIADVAALLKGEGDGVEIVIGGWRYPRGADPVQFKIIVAKRPHYCDRGRYLVYNEAPGLDDADGWPRYYFSFEAMVSEIREWLKARSELQEPT